jgi:hypothetical protein
MAKSTTARLIETASELDTLAGEMAKDNPARPLVEAAALLSRAAIQQIRGNKESVHNLSVSARGMIRAGN